MRRLLYHPESDYLFAGNPRDPNGPDYGQGVIDVCAADMRAGMRVDLGIGHSDILPSFDFETYSEAGFYFTADGKVKGVAADGKGGLPVIGTPNYAEHPSTEVLCLYYNLKDGNGRIPWYPGTPNPQPLLDYIAAGGVIEAWNVTFEFWIWNMVCVRQFGWPPLTMEQCRCAMAKARRSSLPGALGKAAPVLGTPEKHKDGHRLVQKLTRPHTPTKNRPEHRHTLSNAYEDFVSLYRYCDQDTVAEDGASALIPDLTPDEFDTWQLDQRINARGVQVDMQALASALEILRQTEIKYTQELQDITGGQVGSVSEVAKMRDYLNAHGVPIPDIQKDTVDEYLERDDVTGVPRRVLEIRSSLGAANVKKLRTLKLQVSSDGRLRNQYVYCGADQSGRWSAGGVQLQNITAKGPKTGKCEGCGKIFGWGCKGNQGPDGETPTACPRCGSFMFHKLPEWTVDAVEQAIADINTQNLDVVEWLWGGSIALLCGCLRGLFIAAEGKVLICCDFSAVEAMVAACLSRCQWRIEVFSTHGKIYEQSAANATGIPFDEILQYKIDNKMDHPARKGIGKVRELANGYGGWIGANKNFGAEKYFEDDDAIKRDILSWREESPEIVEMWGGQFKWCGPGKWDYGPELFGLEGMAIKAIQNPGECFSYLDITYGVWNDTLHCRLPSGRFLRYHNPRLVPDRHKLTRMPCVKITFWGYNTNSQKGAIGWTLMETYAGRLFENVVQAVAADIQKEALKRVEAANYPLVMHTHDEGTGEVDIGFGSVQDMCRIMSIRPTWAAWWPIRADGWIHKRFQK